MLASMIEFGNDVIGLGWVVVGVVSGMGGLVGVGWWIWHQITKP